MNDSDPHRPRMLCLPVVPRPRVQVISVGHPVGGVAIGALRHHPREMQPPDDFNRSISHDRQYARREPSCGSVAGSTRPPLAVSTTPKKPRTPGTRREAAKHQLAHQPSALRLTPPASRTPTGAARSPPLSAHERTSACQPEQSPRHNIPPANSNCTSSRWSLQFLCRDARRAVTLRVVAFGRAERREALIVRPMSSTR